MRTATILSNPWCNEATRSRYLACGVARVSDREVQLLVRVHIVVNERHADRDIDDLACGETDLVRAVQLVGAFAQGDQIVVRLLGFIDHLQAVHVFDLALDIFSVEGAVLGYIQG